ncbi:MULTISPECIES: imidazole glycerol phosphate synthase subunit HisH [Methanobacterium]|jgi:glutamine amidotransferase|uniref:Imidazole glycerol phosphate synthase subunit HisH n=1 Tax=Methanobacterium bryantii TaxID=2161 RepID=A0A2A2H602_METBR|nr:MULTISPECIES: imidazole glycerol phosphate synthase subunit HisH [Methanobacterium]OEC84589.1 imidazole glycerol phosphate synthase, glutamine amidotransferase subunit [Methanobacterium sp. A39]PAV04891.1 imidazole glycerol phosphate synthase subunit HisH [Methanobacterium bryantii]
MIVIINYGSGNLKSIKNGFTKIGEETLISQDIREMEKADALVLPGVGAFGTAMEHLENYKDIIHEHINNGKPFLGVCLGLQVLFTKSQENKGVKGLDIFKGEVVKIPEEGLKIPHMGWNNLQIVNECSILDGIENDYMYFVHSYYAKPDDEDIIAATTNYGIDLTAAVCRDNVFATQFHPEKSGEVGLNILKNFVKSIPSK